MVQAKRILDDVCADKYDQKNVSNLVPRLKPADTLFNRIKTQDQMAPLKSQPAHSQRARTSQVLAEASIGMEATTALDKTPSYTGAEMEILPRQLVT